MTAVVSKTYTKSTLYFITVSKLALKDKKTQTLT